ncbi:LLM class flavin-dependent oxidoreductase [Streptomyces ipomoeae]|uniref:LLM class flavin-dependent oxidoreductase n=1 Tax=Streptomyces ipomoeae TaxID=103232 RepID=UPI001146FC4F|nr:LLM class flavin-dependent oxidoreductase [Streptomyces ipomoeae]MDX2939796.1 LLM class flavin-dependent oxidoreductase [Streptomyces ipomoeae]TQE17198.1 LLM class flavin-dependent oxidoreductase [Streptomyces ipomoeae]
MTTPAARDDEVRGTPSGNAPVPLSILDAVNVGVGHTSTQALRTSVELARMADARGFHRYWVAEHHSLPSVAATSPAVILAHLAAHTDRIRLGSGGVMLPNHAPLAIAEQFGTLEALAPGRIDLGLGRAPGTDGATAAALRRTDNPHASGDDFPQQVLELAHFLDDDFPDGHPYRHIHAVPGPIQGSTPGGVQDPHRPPLWILGSSGFGARLAGALGLPFAFGHHFAPHNTVAALDLYRESFQPSKALSAPYALISVMALAADDEEEARRLVRPSGLIMVRQRTGNPGLFPTPKEAETYPYSPSEQEFATAWNTNTVHGTPDAVRAGLDELHKTTGADELMITTYAHSGHTRLRSYELIADAYGLPAATASSL